MLVPLRHPLPLLHFPPAGLQLTLDCLLLRLFSRGQLVLFDHQFVVGLLQCVVLGLDNHEFAIEIAEDTFLWHLLMGFFLTMLLVAWIERFRLGAGESCGRVLEVSLGRFLVEGDDGVRVLALLGLAH